MQPHVDLAKTDPGGGTSLVTSSSEKISSSHTFMLHLRDCANGGETALLKQLEKEKASPSAEVDGSSKEHDAILPVLAAVAPRRGRLLLFPHACPHAGLPVDAVPKLFLRGELIWTPS